MRGISVDYYVMSLVNVSSQQECCAWLLASQNPQWPESNDFASGRGREDCARDASVRAWSKSLRASANMSIVPISRKAKAR